MIMIAVIYRVFCDISLAGLEETEETARRGVQMKCVVIDLSLNSQVSLRGCRALRLIWLRGQKLCNKSAKMPSKTAAALSLASF